MSKTTEVIIVASITIAVVGVLTYVATKAAVTKAKNAAGA